VFANRNPREDDCGGPNPGAFTYANRMFDVASRFVPAERIWIQPSVKNHRPGRQNHVIPDVHSTPAQNEHAVVYGAIASEVNVPGRNDREVAEDSNGTSKEKSSLGSQPPAL
jgi:hypothetical protein